MRVLHVSAYFAPAFSYGGPPRSLLGLCQALQRAGVEVEVFTTTANGDGELGASPPEGERYEGVPVRYFPLAWPRRLFRGRGLAGALEAGGRRHDLIHGHGLWTLPVWSAARHARRRGLPYVLSPRGMLASGAMRHHAARKRLAYRLIERRHLSSAALLHATSRAEALSIERRVPGVPVAILPNGVDAAPAACARGAFRRAHGLPDEAPLIAFLGRVHPIKRLDLLAAAFDRIRAARPGARLVIAGPDVASHRRRLEPLFRAAGDLVRWTGEVGDHEKWALLADAQALVLCSDSESFGMSVVEALAAGVPVVVTRTCPWAEVETAGCGFWVPQDADAIARGVLDLLADPISARIMGERGRGLVRARYTWDAVARAMIERYEAVAGAWPGRAGAG